MSSPSTYGRYSLVRRIGTGGMAEIWKARVVGPAGFEKTLAIKRVLPDLVDNKEFLDMFVEEAKLVANLVHPNIVQVHDFGQVGDRDWFMAMEYVAGANLAALLQKFAELNRKMPPELALYIATEACKGLGAAHMATDSSGEPLRIVHRDVSPQNILISYGGEVKVTDFGIAKISSAIQRTKEGQVRGKLAYMSPEQASGKSTDHRTDLFALGVVLFELLATKRFYGGGTSAELFARVMRYEAPDDEQLAHVPEAIRPVLTKLLASSPEARFQNAVALEAQLVQLLPAPRALMARQTLAEVMQRLFENERKLETTATLTDNQPTGIAPGSMPVVKTDPNARTSVQPKSGLTLASQSHTLERPRSRKWIALAAIPLVAGAIAIGAWQSQGKKSDPVAVVPTATPAPTATAEIVVAPTVKPRKTATATPRVEPTATFVVASAGKATVNVAAKPWVQVWIDGKQVTAETPLRNHSLPSGPHVFRFVNPGESFTLEKTLVIPPDRRTSIFVDVATRTVKIQP